MPQKTLAHPKTTENRPTASARLAWALVFALVCLAGVGAAARPQREQRPKGEGEQSTQQSRVKGKLTPLRTSDTSDGSRVTITSTSPLSDYSAYRSGDRFFVLIPNSDAAAVRSGMRGRGFEDAQVQKRGEDVLLSFRVEPGAKPRVAQRFNQLDVVFAAPKEQQQHAQGTGGSQTANPPPAETQTGTPAQTPPRQQTAQTATTPDANAEKRAPATHEATGGPAQQHDPNHSTPTDASAGSQSPAAPAGPESASPSTAGTPAAAEPPQIAEARAPAAAAGEPVRITAEQPSTAQPSTSIAAAVVNNWPLALVAALLLVGLGLFLTVRRSSSAAQEPPPVAELQTPKMKAVALAETQEAPAAAKVAPIVIPPPVEAWPSVEAAPVVESAPAGESEAVDESEAEFEPIPGSEFAAFAPAVRTEHEAAKGGRKKKKRGKKGADTPTTIVAASPVTLAQEREQTPAPTSVVEPAAVEQPTAVAAPQVEVEPPPVEETPAVAQWLKEAAVVAAPPDEEAAVAPVEELAPLPPAEPFVEEASTFEETPAVDETPQPVTEIEPAFESQSIAASESSVEIEPAGVDEPDELSPEPPVAEPPTAIEPVALEAMEVGHFMSTLDADEARDEARRLLDGDSYDKSLAAVSDPLARNMIAAELLSALSGRNAERRARAHAAFVEHGYFNEATQKLRHAEAPVERASAARSLGLAGDRLATPDLIAALADESMEVRRAAVEALASVRDPAAAGPLQALLERERKERFRVPRRLVEHAIEVCREAPERLAPTLADRAAAELVNAPTTADPETDTAESHLFEPAAVELPVEPAAVESAIEPYVEPSPAETMADAGPTQASLEGEEAQIEGPVAFVEEEPPTLVASDETVADAAPETVWMAEAEPVRETPAETVSEDEEPAADDAAEPAAPFAAEIHAPAEEPALLGLEFESHQAEPAETAVVPVEGFETARDHARAGAEDWFDVDMAEVEGAGRKADDLDSAGDLASKEIITATPVETPEVARAPVEIEPHVSASAASTPTASETALAVNEAVDAPPGASMTREPTAIAPFGEDDLSAVPRAIQLRLGSDEPEVRAAAVKDLASVGADDAFRVICHGFDDPSVEVRSAAARSLHVLRDDRAEAFTRALREAAPQRRRNIGAAIASSGLAAEAISQLTGESREKTYDAFSLLFLMAKAGEVQPLLRAVEAHPENEVRLAVVKLLALSGQKEILPAFRRLAVRNALPSEVRAAVMEAIYQITSQSAA